MNSMKLRFLLMGCIISAIGSILLVTRGFSSDLVGVLVVGIILFVVGVVWK
jgi:glucose uptake protein GlcU